MQTKVFFKNFKETLKSGKANEKFKYKCFKEMLLALKFVISSLIFLCVKNNLTKNFITNINNVILSGGGIAGCSALYHLSKNGVNAVLLERSKLTSGSTWHTAGMVWSLRPSDIEIELLKSTKTMIAELEAELGESSSWINNGGLFIAHNKSRMDEYTRLMVAGKAFGIESTLLTPSEAKKIFPLLDTESFYGALYSPRDGTIDANTLVNQLAKASKNRGSKVITILWLIYFV